MNNLSKLTYGIFCFALCASLSSAPVFSAKAQEQAEAAQEAGGALAAMEKAHGVDVLPASSLKEGQPGVDADQITDPTLKMTPDKSELIRLDRDANLISIGNPAHLSIMADTARTLVLVPQAPGTTFFTVLDSDGNVIMQRHVIVASPKEKYLRIRSNCAADDKGCQTTRVFYCPDMCHEISVTTAQAQSSAGAETTNSGSSGQSATSSAEPGPGPDPSGQAE